jgi:hypothetical protein
MEWWLLVAGSLALLGGSVALVAGTVWLLRSEQTTSSSTTACLSSLSHPWIMISQRQT